MPVPLIVPNTTVTALDWWNPLSQLANDTEAQAAATDALLAANIAGGGISDLSTWKATVDAYIAGRMPRRKALIEQVNNSTAFQDDNDLTWPVAINSVYLLGPCWLFYDSSAVADLKIQFTVPAGASLTFGGMGLDTALALKNFGATSASTAVTFGGAGAGAARAVQLGGMLTTAGTAGNLVLQWAQNALEASNTNMLNGTFGVLEKMA